MIKLKDLQYTNNQHPIIKRKSDGLYLTSIDNGVYIFKNAEGLREEMIKNSASVIFYNEE